MDVYEYIDYNAPCGDESSLPRAAPDPSIRPSPSKGEERAKSITLFMFYKGHLIRDISSLFEKLRDTAYGHFQKKGQIRDELDKGIFFQCESYSEINIT